MTTVEYLLRSSLVSFFVLKVGLASSRTITGGPGSSPARGRQHHGESTHVREASEHKKAKEASTNVSQPQASRQLTIWTQHYGMSSSQQQQQHIRAAKTGQKELSTYVR